VPAVTVPCCGRPTRENFSISPEMGSVPVRVICTGLPLLVWIVLLSAEGWNGGGCGVGSVLPNPSTLNSVILAQLFYVFPLTVILTNLAVTFVGKLYVSADRDVPLLLPVNTFVKLVPSLETDITKLFTRRFPLYQAISTL
jgi:hypothetical protein